MLPDPRGTHSVSADVEVTRHYAAPVNDAALTALRWQSVDGGWQRASYRVTRVDPKTLELRYTLTDEQVAGVLSYPGGATSQTLAATLPPGPAYESFTLHLHYTAKEAQARALTDAAAKSLVELGWNQLPGGIHPSLQSSVDGAVLVFARDGGVVRATYTLTTHDELEH